MWFKDKFDVVEFVDVDKNVWKLVKLEEKEHCYYCYYECGLFNTKALISYDNAYFDKDKFIKELNNITKNIVLAAKDPETQAFLKQYGKENKEKKTDYDDLPF